MSVVRRRPSKEMITATTHFQTFPTTTDFPRELEAKSRTESAKRAQISDFRVKFDRLSTRFRSQICGLRTENSINVDTRISMTMKNLTPIDVKQVLKDLQQTEKHAFQMSLEGLSPAQKQAKRQERREALKIRKERHEAERQAFRESLEGLDQQEKQAKRRDRKKKIVEQCKVASEALSQATRVTFMSSLSGLTEEEREERWSERRATMQQCKPCWMLWGLHSCSACCSPCSSSSSSSSSSSL